MNDQNDVDVKPFRWGNPMDWHVVRWNQPIYKYVDQEHANAFSNGSVKIGTLWGYRRMEGAKGDSGENSIPLEFGHTSLHTSTRTTDSY